MNWTELRSRIALRPALVLGVLLVAGVWLWNTGMTLPDGKTHVEFLDAGSPATLVRSPRGARILIDGGTNPSAVLSALGERMPFWEHSLDLLVLTHADDDHLAGLVTALERYDVRQIIQVGPPAKLTAAYLKWQDLIAAKHTPVLLAQPGLQMAVDDDLVLEILPSGESSDTAVVRLTVGQMAFLFAGSAEPEEQVAVMASGADPTAAVVLPPRQVQPGFLDAVGPHFVVLFSGDNERDQPKPELLAAVSGTTVLRTDEHGTIDIITDAMTLAIKTAR